MNLNYNKTKYLKPELGKKPAILPSLEPLLEPLLRLLGGSDLLVLALERISGDDVLQVHIESVASGHQMLVVHQLDEGLDA